MASFSAVVSIANDARLAAKQGQCRTAWVQRCTAICVMSSRRFALGDLRLLRQCNSRFGTGPEQISLGCAAPGGATSRTAAKGEKVRS